MTATAAAAVQTALWTSATAEPIADFQNVS
jgi:hypothetical protein